MLTDLFTVTLVDLGASDIQLAGILCPEPEIGAERVGITDQFLGDAETYASRYGNTAHFQRLFEQAFEAACIEPGPRVTILDIGTGSGANTIPPCLALFEECRIVATDLSPDLLRMLRRHVVEQGLADRVACICTDGMNDFFKPDSFDIVVGAAILHHLIDPARALAAAHRALKPGGIALFFEPFEGLGIIRIAFDLILARATGETPPLDSAAAKLLTAILARTNEMAFL